MNKNNSDRNVAAVQNIQESESGLTFDSPLYDLFFIEVQNQTTLLTQNLLDLEASGKKMETLEALMRAAHSIKGAAKILRLDPLVHLSHTLEDCFAAVQKNMLDLSPEHIDILLKSIDIIAEVKKVPQPQLKLWLENAEAAINERISQIQDQILSKRRLPARIGELPVKQEGAGLQKAEKSQESIDRVIRVTAHNLNRLMGLAGESLVESQWLHPFSTSLLKTKKKMHSLAQGFDGLRRDILDQKKGREYINIKDCLSKLQREIHVCSRELSDRIAELEMFIVKNSSLSDRLYGEVVETHMRPFADVLYAFPRLVRDLSRELNKTIHFEIIGKATFVDRDILEKLETPLNHLIRNAIDHGIEPADQRIQSGKPPEGTIKIEAMHRAGMLVIQVSDDGKGIDMEELRKSVVARNLAAPEIAERLSQEELLEFIFLPGFSTTQNPNEISGRGMGMNAITSRVHEVGGTLRVQTTAGKGTSFQMTLPLTLSVLRALIVEIDNELYAFPLGKIDKALKIKKDQVLTIDSIPHIQFADKNISLVHASKVFDLKEAKIIADDLPVILISGRTNTYGIIVDKFLSEKELVVHELDSLLGKTPLLSSGAFLDDGSPVLILDIEDMVRSIESQQRILK